MVQFTGKYNLNPRLLIFLLPQSTITADAKKWKKDHLACVLARNFCTQQFFKVNPVHAKLLSNGKHKKSRCRLTQVFHSMKQLFLFLWIKCSILGFSLDKASLNWLLALRVICIVFNIDKTEKPCLQSCWKGKNSRKVIFDRQIFAIIRRSQNSVNWLASKIALAPEFIGNLYAHQQVNHFLAFLQKMVVWT